MGRGQNANMIELSVQNTHETRGGECSLYAESMRDLSIIFMLDSVAPRSIVSIVDGATES